MEAVSRWLCSFVADEVTVEQHQNEQSITCGEKVLLCSIGLTNLKSTFTNYHDDKIAVSYRDGNPEAGRSRGCEWSIEVNPKLINVYFTAYRAGNVTVTLDLGKWYIFQENGSWSSSKHVDVEFVPSIPHRLNDVKFTTTPGAVDESFCDDCTVMYRNQWSLLEATLVDCYDNVIQDLNDYNISLKLSGDEGKMAEMKYEEVKFPKGLQTKVKINKTGKHQLLITLTCKGNQDNEYHLEDIPVEVVDAPLSLARSKFYYGDTSVAGKGFQVEIHPVDVFGCPLPAHTTTDYKLRGSISETNKNNETVDLNIVKNEVNLVIYVSVVLTKAGSRKVIVFDKDNQSKVITIDVNPDLTDLHWELTAQKETAYRRENLALSVSLLDRFNNKVHIYSSVGYIPQLVTADEPDGLRCTMRSIEDYKVTFRCHFIIKGEYDLLLTDHEGNSLDGTSVSITVQDAPLDRSRSSIRWIPEYDDIPSQPVFPKDESFRCRLELWDVVGHKYDKIVASDCIKVKKGNIVVRDIEVTRNEDKIGSYNIVVQSNPGWQYYCYVNGIKIENPIALPKNKEFEKYDDGKCQLHYFELDCYGAEKRDIECSHLVNIKRVCDLSGRLEVEDFGNVVRVKLPVEEIVYNIHGRRKIECSPEEIHSKLRKFRNILLHLLRAIYYRQEAFELDKAREKWKEMANEYYRKVKEGDSIDRDIPHFCSEIKEKYAALMRRYHDAACDEFFQFYNTDRDQSEIDLHGLLVVDEKKLRDYEQQLLSKEGWTLETVKRKIEEERSHGNEALRKLQQKLRTYDMRKAREVGEPWLEIIVGAGHHSKGKIKERQKIRPKVEEYLKGKKIKFSPANKGALVVTFEPYAGEEPCYGEYYCSKCDNNWRNDRSWIGKWQACNSCYERSQSLEKCYPLKQRPRRKQQRYNSNDPPRNKKRNGPGHAQKLCQKCRELGRPCARASVSRFQY